MTSVTNGSSTLPRGEIGIASAIAMTAVGGYVDAYLFLRHQVFGFAQTGNVVFLAVGLVQGSDWTKYLWPLLVYIAGLVVAELLHAGAATVSTRILQTVLIFQILVFATLALLPVGAPTQVFVLPLSFVAGVRMELFRSAGGMTFMSIASTGNLMRLVQASAELARGGSPTRRRAAGFTALVVLGFAGGAICGAALSRAVGPALWGAVILECASLVAFLTATRRRS